MVKKAKAEVILSTEEKIKEAARKVFTHKGYAATRTRDIAEAAGINLALLNYYFRSKEKLFEIIMIEKMLKFFGVLAPVLNDAATTLETKVAHIAMEYTHLLLQNPDLPLFILSEVRNSPEQLVNLVQTVNVLNGSVFIKQIQQKKPDINPLQYLMSLLGMCVFPYAMKPVLQMMTKMSEKEFTVLMKDRESLIPVWTKAMLKAK